MVENPLSIPEAVQSVKQAVARSGRDAWSPWADTYTVVEHSSDAAEIEVSYRGRKYRERLTWQDGQREPFVCSKAKLKRH